MVLTTPETRLLLEPAACASLPLLPPMRLPGVLSPPERVTPWNDRMALRTLSMTSSIIRELLKWTERPDVISFAGGLPAPEAFPAPEIAEAARRVLAERPAEALQYGTTEGYLPLRQLLALHMAARHGVRVGPENVLITSGSQQALDLVGRLFLDPGDRVVTEQPTFLGALQAFTAYQAGFLPVRMDDDGMRLDELEERLRSGPKLIYALPNFQNPTGVTLGLDRRRRLVELACHYGVPIVEDDPCGELRYEGDHLPPLVSLDAGLHGSAGCGGFGGNVLYLSSFSKTLAPGLRVAWMVAPANVIARLVQMKQGADLHTSTLAQHVVYEVVRDGFLDRHLPVVRRLYDERRRAMLAALEGSFPPGVRWTTPRGGLFLWVTLPAGADAFRLLDAALAEGVAFVPGAPFHPGGGGESTLRLNFSYSTPYAIAEGIRRLGGVLRSGRS